jgi:hypothetical protein
MDLLSGMPDSVNDASVVVLGIFLLIAAIAVLVTIALVMMDNFSDAWIISIIVAFVSGVVVVVSASFHVSAVNAEIIEAANDSLNSTYEVDLSAEQTEKLLGISYDEDESDSPAVDIVSYRDEPSEKLTVYGSTEVEKGSGFSTLTLIAVDGEYRLVQGESDFVEVEKR